MATPQDIAFLRLAISNGIADKATAERCVQLVDEGLRRGEALSAAHVALSLGIIPRDVAERLWIQARESLAQAPSLGDMTQRFQKPILPPPPVGAAPSGAPASGTTGRFAPPPPGTAPGAGPPSGTGRFPPPAPAAGSPPSGTGRFPPGPPSAVGAAIPQAPAGAPASSRPPLMPSGTGPALAPRPQGPPSGTGPALAPRPQAPPSGTGLAPAPSPAPPPAAPAPAARQTGRFAPPLAASAPAAPPQVPGAPPAQPQGPGAPASPSPAPRPTGRFPVQAGAPAPSTTGRFGPVSSGSGLPKTPFGSQASAPGTADEGDAETELALAGYELQKKLGRGPSGAAYELRIRGDARAYVGKVLSRKFAKHPQLHEQIVADLRRAAGFDHPGVVALREVVQAGGRDLLVHDKAEGQTLAERLQKGPLTTAHATDAIIELGRALEKAHAKGLFHGDVRPAKVFIDNRGKVRLADFGLAQASCLSSGLGQFGLAFGHPDYLPPEAVQEKLPRPNARTDVYALGILYYELSCGVPPFHGNNPRETLKQHLEKTLPPPPENVKISTAMAGVILRMTAKDPARRYPDMASAIRAVEEYKQARSKGLTSDADGDAAVNLPLDNDQPISPAEWGKQSEDAASRSEEWKADKIEAAERIGPEEWTPDASMEGGPVARYRGDEDSDQPAPAKAATGAGYLEALREAAGGSLSNDPDASNGAAAPAPAEGVVAVREPAADGKKDKRDKAAKGGAGTRLELKGRADAEAQARSTTVGVLLLGGLVLIGTAGAYAYGHKKTKHRSLEEELAKVQNAGPLPPVPSPAPLQVDEDREKREQAIRAALDARANDVRPLVTAGDWRRALDKAREPNAAYGSTPLFRDGVAKLVADVKEAARLALARDRQVVDELVKANEFVRAGEVARRAENEAVEELKPVAKELSDLVAKGQTAYAAKYGTASPAAASVDPSSLEGMLAGTLHASLKLHPGDAVDVEYGASTGDFALDTTALEGKRPRSIPGTGFRLDGSSEALVAVHRLPFVRPVAAHVEFLVPPRVSKEALFAVVAGAAVERPSGFGATWWLVPVSLGPVGVEILPGLHESRRLALAPNQTHVFDVAFRPPLADGRVFWTATLDQNKAPERGTLDVERFRGFFGFYVKSADVTVTSLRLSGIVDVPALKKLKAPPKK